MSAAKGQAGSCQGAASSGLGPVMSHSAITRSVRSPTASVSISSSRGIDERGDDEYDCNGIGACRTPASGNRVSSSRDQQKDDGIQSPDTSTKWSRPSWTFNTKTSSSW